MWQLPQRPIRIGATLVVKLGAAGAALPDLLLLAGFFVLAGLPTAASAPDFFAALVAFADGFFLAIARSAAVRRFCSASTSGRISAGTWAAVRVSNVAFASASEAAALS